MPSYLNSKYSLHIVEASMFVINRTSVITATFVVVVVEITYFEGWKGQQHFQV